MPEWAKKQLRLFGKDLPEDVVRHYRWSRPIAPPATPPRYDRDEPPLDLDDELDDLDDWDEQEG
jgi:hypothetical protein